MLVANYEIFRKERNHEIGIGSTLQQILEIRRSLWGAVNEIGIELILKRILEIRGRLRGGRGGDRGGSEEHRGEEGRRCNYVGYVGAGGRAGLWRWFVL